jgi:hypothetical protein
MIGQIAALTIVATSLAWAAADENDAAAASDWRNATVSAYTWTQQASSPSAVADPGAFIPPQLPRFGNPELPSYLPYGEPFLPADLTWAPPPQSNNLQWRPADFLLDKIRGDRRPTGHPVQAGFYLHTIRFKVNF